MRFPCLFAVVALSLALLVSPLPFAAAAEHEHEESVTEHALEYALPAHNLSAAMDALHALEGARYAGIELAEQQDALCHHDEDNGHHEDHDEHDEHESEEEESHEHEGHDEHEVEAVRPSLSHLTPPRLLSLSLSLPPPLSISLACGCVVCVLI
jgi:hypothetical protein